MKILFAADISLNYMGEKEWDQEAMIMARTAQEFRNADFSVVNLENVLGCRESYTPVIKTGPNLCSPDASVAYLDVLSPTVVGLANNHAGDYGDEALFHTMDLLRQKGYQVIGAGENRKAAYKPAILERNGETVWVIAVCENEFGTAGKDTAGSAGYNLTCLKEVIRSAQHSGAKPIIYFHGGVEYDPFPSPGKKELYRLFVDLGAAAVIAMHTHCPQGYEIYEGCPIVYSMGNFFFPAKWDCHPSWNLGYMVLLDVNRQGITMETIPYSFSTEDHTILEGERKLAFEHYMQKLLAPLDDDDRLEELFYGWCVIGGLRQNLEYAKYEPSMREGDPDQVKRETRIVKNLFSCEAHHEVIRQTLKMIFDNRCEKYDEEIAEIERLQNIVI